MLLKELETRPPQRTVAEPAEADGGQRRWASGCGINPKMSPVDSADVRPILAREPLTSS